MRSGSKEGGREGGSGLFLFLFGGAREEEELLAAAALSPSSASVAPSGTLECDSASSVGGSRAGELLPGPGLVKRARRLGSNGDEEEEVDDDR